MAWLGGFAGDSYNRAEFRAWLRKQKKPSFMNSITVHATGAPYTLAFVGGKQRMANLATFYKNKKPNPWKGGPHGFVMEDRVYPGTPIHLASIHSPSWNNTSLAIEVEGLYDGKKHSHLNGKGGLAWETCAWVVAEILDWMQWDVDAKHIKFHRDDPATTHKVCPSPPGVIDKTWFIDMVRAAMGTAAPTPTPVPKEEKFVWVSGVPTGEYLNTRSGGGMQYAVNGKLPNGAKLKVLAEVTGWLQVRTQGGYIVWVSKPYTIDTEQPVQPKPAPEPIVAPKQPEPNPAKGMRILQTEFSWPKHWAAGAIAQAQRESYPDLRPWAKGDWVLDGAWVKANTPGASPTAFGIWQYRNERWTNYLKFAEKAGMPWDDFATQVRYCPEELKVSEKLAWKWLLQAKTVEQACAAMVWYERPKGYISSKAKAATTWDDVFAVSEKCDGYDVRLKFARALM